MATQITMPKLSDTMEEGTILRWFKQVGQSVEQGEVIAEVETDKADMELEAESSGVLQEIKVPEGQIAAVGAVIAVLSDATGSRTATTSPAAPNPPAPEAPAPTTATPAQVKPPAPAAKPAAAPSRPAASVNLPPGQPVAPTAAAPPPAAMKWKPRPQPGPAVEPGRRAISKLRQTVAKQMAASKREVPHFYVTSEIDMSEAARMRRSLQESGIFAERITFTHLLIRALTLALQRHPQVNASWNDGVIEVHSDINIGIAVAVDDGLVAPVLHRCQELTLAQIARATQGLVEKAQSGKFSGAEMTGATFSISNMGMLDIDEFSAVITPPQAAILAVGAIKDRPIVRAGQLAIGQTMRVTLSVDHRVLNGVEAGRFLEDLKRSLEQPVLLVIDGQGR
jgi:pyruvate dehydrogenase E2 component (dihydrolipoamide acetyltransferase)